MLALVSRIISALNHSAQNALLKVLEEPPSGAIIILITAFREKLLPTILSRCQMKKFNSISREELAASIDSAGLNREDILFWSLGRPGLARKLEENKEELEERKKGFRELDELLGKNLSEKFLFCEELGRNSVRTLEKLELWTILFREEIAGRKKLRISPEKALGILEEIGKSAEIIRETNANTRLVLENLVLDF